MSRVRRSRSPVVARADAAAPRPIAATPSRTTHPQRLGFVVYAALAVLWLAAGWNPDPRLWGVHILGFLPRPVWFIAWLGFAMFAAPSLARSFASGWLRATGALVGSWSRTLWVALAAGVAFWVFRLRFQFLG